MEDSRLALDNPANSQARYVVIASMTRLARICGAIAYLINSLLHRSRTVARYTHPSPVGKQLMSPINFSPGMGEENALRIKSDTAAAPAHQSRHPATANVQSLVLQF